MQRANLPPTGKLPLLTPKIVSMQVAIEASWKQVLAAEFEKPYFEQIAAHIKAEKANGQVIYPSGKQIFHAFACTPFAQVKVVLLGQDPYHNPGQAMGLSFSVPDGVPPPPSLQNMYKELATDIGINPPKTGNLSSWAQQGVLLLNAGLTVRANEPNSHKLIGWQQFTDAVISVLSEQKTNLVFLLWGKFAQEKAKLINARKHCILTAAHPSPLSAHNGFFGCKHFSKSNEYLTKHLQPPINWAP